eukprot:scaffold8018_cov80-Cylindrotheca_fusiformis.AAC.1
MSMAIDPIVKLLGMGKLNERQAVELCFAASLLNQPLRFHYVMEQFVMRAYYDKEDFAFQQHPFHDWVRLTKKEFVGQWQGGPFRQYSPHKQKDIEDIFGTDNDGLSRLTTVIDILIKVLKFVNTLAGRKRQDLVDADFLNEKFGVFLEEIKTNCQGCDFAFFRLAVFLTMANACCLTKPGRHLRQLFLSAPRTAAYSHL